MIGKYFLRCVLGLQWSRFLALLGKRPIFVYQMGKVGSMSVAYTLRKLGFIVCHAHFLTPMGLAEDLRRRSPRWEYSSAWKEQDYAHDWQFRHIAKWINKPLGGKKWKVITLVREPIAREISVFFEDIIARMPNVVENYKRNLISAQQVVDNFLASLPSGESTFTWFDSEMKPTFGVDVFAEDFPKSKGYKIYEGERAQVLLLKMENLDECAPDAFREFMGMENFVLRNVNLGEDKEYKEVYRGFKESIVLPQAYLDKMYQSAYVQQFYSEEEVNRYIARWSKR